MATRLLIAFDGSSSSVAAVDAAAALFGGAHAVVATVPQRVDARADAVTLAVPTISPDVVVRTLEALESEAREEAERTAGEGAERARERGLDAGARVAAPQPPTWSALLALAHDEGADALVCGTRGRSALARVLLGSTSTSLLHHADLPLLVVPGEAGERDGPTVLAYDGSAAAQRAIDVAGQLLGDRPIVVTHVWESQYRRGLMAKALARGPVDEVREIVEVLDQSVQGNAEQCTQDGVDRARAAGLDAVGAARESEAAVWQAVLSVAREQESAVIVSGARGLGGARSALLGSVSSGLIHHAETPVLIVPG
jgi:nucleotide-binding universal stress UspA family protein